MGKILSLKLNFSPNNLGNYGLRIDSDSKKMPLLVLSQNTFSK